MGSGDLEKGMGKQRYAQTYSAAGMEYSHSRWTSWLIPVIVFANIAMFVVTMLVNNCPDHRSEFRGECVAKFLGRFSFQPTKENPTFGPSSSTLEKLGALVWHDIVREKQAWRLVTSCWLHAGLIHLLVNMLSLLFIGIRLEQQFGFVRVGVIYLLSGVGGSILSCLFIQRSITVGASGALFGLLGAMLAELLTNWTIYTNKAAALITLVVVIAVNLAVGILPYVNNFAHIGGFLTGLLLGFILLIRPQFGWLERRNIPADVRVKSKYTVCQYTLWIVATILFIAGFSVGLIMLFRGENVNKKCSWCHYLSCVPTSKWRFSSSHYLYIFIKRQNLLHSKQNLYTKWREDARCLREGSILKGGTAALSLLIIETLGQLQDIFTDYMPHAFK